MMFGFLASKSGGSGSGGFVGLDVGEAPRLVAQLHTWPPLIDEVILLVNEAERLADMPVNITGQLDQIGADGRTMALAVERALAKIENHQLSLLPVDFGVKSPGFTPVDDDKSGKVFGPLWQDASELAIDDAKVIAQRWARIEELRAEIQRSTADDRDPRQLFVELNWLLGHLVGLDSTENSISLLMNGLDTADLVDGPDAVLHRIAWAMVDGLTPAQVGLPDAVFPAAYVAWHERSALIDQLELTIARREALLSALDEIAIRGFSKGTVGEQIDALSWSPLERHQVLQRLSRLYPGLTADAPHQVSALVQAEVDELRQQVEQLITVQATSSVDTLHGESMLSKDGRLGLFGAIGAAGSLVPVTPSAFLSDSYIDNFHEFDIHEIERMVSFLASDRDAAVAFFATFGAEATAMLLTELQWLPGFQDHVNHELTTSVIARDLSIALGLASDELAVTFARELVQTRPEWDGQAVPIAPEWLFAYGHFDPDFLVAAAAESFTLNDGKIRQFGSVDPRALIFEPVLAAGLGADVVNALASSGNLDTLIWPPVAIEGLYIVGERHLPFDPQHVPLVSQLLMQVAVDERASAYVIEAGGSHLGELHIDIANGMSQVLAAQVPNYLHADSGDAYFDAVQNVFSAGVGIEILAASHDATVTALSLGFEHQELAWWSSTAHVGHFTGEIADRQYLVFFDNAETKDKAIRNANAWISGSATGLGIVIGIAGAPATGGGSYGWAGSGAGAGILGWLVPQLLDDPDKLVTFLEGSRNDALNNGLDAQALVIWAAASAGAITVAGGSVRTQIKAGRHVLVIDDGFVEHKIEVDWLNPDWILDAYDLFEQVDARIDVDMHYKNQGRPVRDGIAQIASQAYGDTHFQALGD